jgi:transposase
VARTTIQDNLKRAAAAARLAWPLPGDLTEDVLEARLFA